MLADRIEPWIEGPFGGVYGEQGRHDLRVFGQKVKRAPRFDLQRDAVFLVENLSRTVAPSRMIDALDLCRLPFPTMWIEFVYKDRNDWKAIAAREGRYSESDWNTELEPDAPSRIGFLLEDTSKDDERSFVAHLIWNAHSVDALNPCYKSIEFDTQVREPVILSAEEIERHHGVRAQNSWAQSWHGNPKEESATIDIMGRLNHFVPRHNRALQEMTLQTIGQVGIDQMNAAATYDLAGEWRFLLSLLMVLNSRNVVQYGDEVAYEKLNKQRIKKDKLPLLSHRPITLHLSRAQYSRMGVPASAGTGLNPRDIRPQLVRGHWKLRKSGLFFWSEHSRGEVTEAPIYRVRA